MKSSLRCFFLFLPFSLLIACGGSGDEDSSQPINTTAGTGGISGQSGGGNSGHGGQSAGASGAGAGGTTAGFGGNTIVGGTSGSSGAGQAGVGGKEVSGGAGGEAGNSGEAGEAGESQGGAGAGQGGSGGSIQGGDGGVGGEAGQGGAGGNEPCGGCKEGFVCKYDVCVPNLGACGSNEDCPGDSYCDLNDMTCTPYGVPPGKTNDPTCEKQQVPTEVTPAVQCEWAGTAAGDPTSTMIETYSTPLVADLNLDLDPKKIQPSIIMATFDFNYKGKGRTGMLRVFDGRTCEEQMRIGGPDDPEVEDNRAGYVGGWAVGDLDGDVGTPNGHPEIVGFHRVGLVNDNDPLTVIAFGIDTSDVTKPKLVRRWIGRDCSNNKPFQFMSNQANFTLNLHDLDDDGKPEIIVERLVFDANGCVLNPQAVSQMTSYGLLGIINTIADADLDGKPDLIHYDGVYGWDSSAKDWVLKPWSVKSAALTAGNLAIADVGHFSEIPGHKKTDPLPEIIVTAGGKIRVQTLTGDIVFGPLPIHQGGIGGPPTAADFDGDGQVEFAAAGAKMYVVYDPDCLPGADPSARPGGVCTKSDNSIPDGILWEQPSQDLSSNCTGSSVFDFNGDGKAEVIYRDECFVRIYDGSSGTVLYSAPASSGTGYEYPVIADVDGDFATEIVVPRTKGISCPSGPDKLYPNSGNFNLSSGFVVLRDPEDRWVSSRPIWNQHAYSITDVTDDARIPKSSEVKRNWEQPGLNNFRQNTQGSLKALALADLTVELQDAEALCSGQAGSFQVKAKVCNRGTNPVQDGAEVAFSQGKKGSPTVALCETVTDTLLQPGDCTVVTCTGELEAENDVLITVDPKKKIADCHPGNNQGASARLLCGKP